MQTSRQRSKDWVFTLNNYTEDELRELKELLPTEKVCYIIWGYERGEEGTPHLQGYMELPARASLRTVKAFPGMGRCHLEPRRGSQAEAIGYCRQEEREDNPCYEAGEKRVSRQGHRSDLDEIRRKLTAGATMREIADSHFGDWVRYRKSFQDYAGLVAASESRAKTVVWIYGPPGTGKTRSAFEANPGAYITWRGDLQWFDGYDGERVIIVDDYRGEAPDSFILRFLDRYPLRLPTKGGSVALQATKIIVTSNLPPTEVHRDVNAALRRRIRSVWVPENIYDGESVVNPRLLREVRDAME